MVLSQTGLGELTWAGVSWPQFHQASVVGALGEVVLLFAAGLTYSLADLKWFGWAARWFGSAHCVYLEQPAQACPHGRGTERWQKHASTFQTSASITANIPPPNAIHMLNSESRGREMKPTSPWRNCSKPGTGHARREGRRMELSVQFTQHRDSSPNQDAALRRKGTCTRLSVQPHMLASGAPSQQGDQRKYGHPSMLEMQSFVAAVPLMPNQPGHLWKQVWEYSKLKKIFSFKSCYAIWLD